MDINAANLSSLFRNVKVDWQKGVAWRPTVDLSFLVMDVPSTSAANFYAWLNMIPAFREWVGDRIFRNLKSDSFEVKNVPYEASTSMERDKLRDDLFSIYSPQLTMMGQGWQQLLFKIAVDVLLNNTTSFTASAMCSNSHAYGDQTIDNLVTDALSADALDAAFLARAGYKWSNGEEIPGTWTHLVYGPKNHGVAFNLVVNEYLSVAGGSTTSNPNYKRVIPVELPSLTGTYDDYWFLTDASGPMRAICRQIRENAEPFMDLDPATVMRNGRVDVMADGRAAAAPTFPHLIYGGIL